MFSAEGYSAPRDPLVGQVIQGRYRIDHVIGKGAMGVVYEAQHLLSVGREVSSATAPPAASEHPILPPLIDRSQLIAALIQRLVPRKSRVISEPAVSSSAATGEPVPVEVASAGAPAVQTGGSAEAAVPSTPIDLGAHFTKGPKREP